MYAHLTFKYFCTHVQNYQLSALRVKLAGNILIMAVLKTQNLHPTFLYYFHRIQSLRYVFECSAVCTLLINFISLRLCTLHTSIDLLHNIYYSLNKQAAFSSLQFHPAFRIFSQNEQTRIFKNNIMFCSFIIVLLYQRRPQCC